MITYEPGKWGLGFALTLKGSIFPKSFVLSAPCAAICCVLHVSIGKWTDFHESQKYSTVAGSVLAGFTAILGFLIVFRSQQAYSRWWEGGSLLQQIRGEWFNAYSCLLAFCSVSEEKEEEVALYQHKIVRLFSLLYASGLEQVTTSPDAVFEIIELEGFDLDSLYALKSANDRCEVVLQWIQKVVVQGNAQGTLQIAPPILSRVFQQLGNGIVNLNNARKITEFPIPFPLAQMVAFMLVCHWIMTCWICTMFIPDVFIAVSACFLVVFAFWTINYISLELEMPFGDDPNDLPLEDMQKDFNQSLIALLQPRFAHPPDFFLTAHRDDLMCTNVFLDAYIDDLFIQKYTESDEREARQASIMQRGNSSASLSEKVVGGKSEGKRDSTPHSGDGVHSGKRMSLPVHADMHPKPSDQKPKPKAPNCARSSMDLAAQASIDAKNAANRIVKVVVAEASGLRAADFGGTSDPYVMCEVPGKKALSFKTPVVKKCLTPLWNHEHEYNSVELESSDPLQFTVWDSDPMGDDLLGTVSLTPDMFQSHGFDGELVLQDAGKGQIAKLLVRISISENGNIVQPPATPVVLASPPVYRQDVLPETTSMTGSMLTSINEDNIQARDDYSFNVQISPEPKDNADADVGSTNWQPNLQIHQSNPEQHVRNIVGIEDVLVNEQRGSPKEASNKAATQFKPVAQNNPPKPKPIKKKVAKNLLHQSPPEGIEQQTPPPRGDRAS